MNTRYRLDLTSHQRAALLHVIADVMSQSQIDISIDATTGEEIPISALLALVLNAPVITTGGQDGEACEDGRNAGAGSRT